MTTHRLRSLLQGRHTAVIHCNGGLGRKLNTLLDIITLAMAWAYASATAIKGTKPINVRDHGYRYKSWFRLGFDQLRKWILHHPLRAAEIWTRIWPKRKSTLKIQGVV